MTGVLLGYQPFVSPLVQVLDYWYLLLIPLSLLIALVYKAARTDDLATIHLATCKATLKVLGLFTAVAVTLWLVVLFLERKG